MIKAILFQFLAGAPLHQIEKQAHKLNRLQDEKQALLKWINSQRTKTHNTMMQQLGNKSPNEKKVYALQCVKDKLAEIENRILDGEFYVD